MTSLLTPSNPDLALNTALELLRSLAGTDTLGTIVQEHLATGGKYVRARLASAASVALGAPRDSASGWAAACEMAHNATLVHDDLQDGDTVRRSQPTTWVKHGMPQAINAGDLMFMAAQLAIDSVPTSNETKWHLSRCLASHLANVIRGQAFEFELRQRLL